MDWQWPLFLVSAVFIATMIWRLRPAMPPARSVDRKSLHAARTKLESASTDAVRAEALCEAGEISARAGRVTSAEGYFLRAMRAAPHDETPVSRAAISLTRYPRALEALLWRRLGAEAWHEPNRRATIVTLTHLKTLYEGPRRKRVQARALEFARDALEAMEPAAASGAAPAQLDQTSSDLK